MIGIHATAFPGPDPALGLYQNIVSNPAEIGQDRSRLCDRHVRRQGRTTFTWSTISYAIARFKAKATTTPIANCSGCKMLETINMPLGEASARMTPAVSGLLARHGDSWWMTTCCDGYYTNVAAALRAADASTDKIKLVGADAPPSAYDMIRKGGFEVASVPEPSSLFGYEAMDAVVRAMAGAGAGAFPPAGVPHREGQCGQRRRQEQRIRAEQQLRLPLREYLEGSEQGLLTGCLAAVRNREASPARRARTDPAGSLRAAGGDEQLSDIGH